MGKRRREIISAALTAMPPPGEEERGGRGHDMGKVAHRPRGKNPTPPLYLRQGERGKKRESIREGRKKKRENGGGGLRLPPGEREGEREKVREKERRSAVGEIEEEISRGERGKLRQAFDNLRHPR